MHGNTWRHKHARTTPGPPRMPGPPPGGAPRRPLLIWRAYRCSTESLGSHEHTDVGGPGQTALTLQLRLFIWHLRCSHMLAPPTCSRDPNLTSDRRATSLTLAASTSPAAISGSPPCRESGSMLVGLSVIGGVTTAPPPPASPGHAELCRHLSRSTLCHMSTNAT